MIKETVKPEFSGIDFINLYCAITFKNGYSPIINHHELEKKLYEFYSLVEFKELFQDICPKIDYINPENSYLDLGVVFQTAQLYGLLSQVHDAGETQSIINCNDYIARKIISNADDEMINKMENLFIRMFEIDDNFKKKYQEPTLIKRKES